MENKQITNNIDYDKIYSEVGDIFIKMMITVREKIIKDIEISIIKPILYLK